ncbi:two-component system sensor histidine kinase NtrB [Bacillus sp. FJAT-45350]|uniref:two-component system sensor histidine kinase NtrB n=1 Tax=Bacillus sp. FJAT-45350 TaxID=2011014 RepID=UPI00211C907D|nr:HAMP domain-containing sensor histidine kinase [Bacillus sp. FJAT-45350]
MDFYESEMEKSIPSEENEILKQLNIPYVKVDENKLIIDCNNTFLELFGEVSLDFIRYKEISLFEAKHVLIYPILQLIQQIQETYQSNYVEYEKEELFYHIKGIPSKDNRSIYLFVYDYSLEKRFENLVTFHHQMEEVSQIAAGVAHELRNPLSVIKGFLQLAELTNGYQKYSGTIMSELNRMNGIIEDFLSVSRKKTERKIQEPDLIMTSLVEIIKSECLLHNVTFKHHIERTDEKVEVNEPMIKQVMLNLLRNSIEAYENKQDRSFELTTFRYGDYYKIVVEDNGPGMNHEVLAQLGKPFFTTKEKGTGVGIPLCKKIIEDHGGSFEISSEINQGTTIEINLPLT